MLLALLPVTAVTIGWLALDQRPSRLDLVGIALVLAGVVLQERDELAAELAAPDPADVTAFAGIVHAVHDRLVRSRQCGRHGGRWALAASRS